MHINQGLAEVTLAGRFQEVAGPVTHYFDVTHNVQGAINLANLLASTPCEGRTIAVLGMLKDKNASAVAERLNATIDAWYVGGLSGNRGQSGPELSTQIEKTVSDKPVYVCDTVADAYISAKANAKQGDRLLIFGSFHTVESVMLLLA